MKTLAKWSVEEYHQMLAAGILQNRRVELIEGEIWELSPEKPLHRKFTDRTADYLRERLQGQAKVYEAHPITLSESEPEPDLAIVRLPVSLYDERHPTPADIYWLMEIADTTLSEDLSRKKRIYALSHIQEYWVIDLNASKLKVFRLPINGEYTEAIEKVSGEIVPLAFPGLQISVQRLLT